MCLGEISVEICACDVQQQAQAKCICICSTAHVANAFIRSFHLTAPDSLRGKRIELRAILKAFIYRRVGQNFPTSDFSLKLGKFK